MGVTLLIIQFHRPITYINMCDKFWKKHTCSPTPLYMHRTTLSNKLMSSFWLKSRSLEACSARVAIQTAKLLEEIPITNHNKLKYFRNQSFSQNYYVYLNDAVTTSAKS
jgi:hypothetical protein